MNEKNNSKELLEEIKRIIKQDQESMISILNFIEWTNGFDDTFKDNVMGVIEAALYSVQHSICYIRDHLNEIKTIERINSDFQEKIGCDSSIKCYGSDKE